MHCTLMFCKIFTKEVNKFSIINSKERNWRIDSQFVEFF